mmetsp:Transcript_16960/g.40601  ORF Transcript_16960/g.40601 Transcript_16960/m.40601 type:complete len:574 (-) Transcript_16960:97-1818(-)
MVGGETIADAQDTSCTNGRSIMVGDAPFDSYRSCRSEDESSILSQSSAGQVEKGFNPLTQSQQQARTAAHRSRVRPDYEILSQSVADAGLNAFGCVFLEVWAMSDDGTKLVRPSGGHWMDPAFAQSLANDDLIEKAWELDRVVRDCPPGAGLAGTLAEEAGSGARHVHWRQIKSLLGDPFVQRGPGKRMERFIEIGIGLVAAVPFSFQEERGIVLYFSRGSANTEMLRASSNERFLIISADVIGANFSIRKAREESVQARRKMFQESIKKVRKEMFQEKPSLAQAVMDKDFMAKLREQAAREAAQSEEGNIPRMDTFAVKMAKYAVKFGKRMFKRVNNSRRKWRGAKLHGPPRQSFKDCLFAFTGAFLTMLTILKIASSVRTDSKFDFDGGWYSSTLCIVYALTPAPVGQPRQIFAAHLWNMLVGLACRHIPDGGYNHFMEGSDYGMPLIWKQALAVALGIAGQAYIGILHPPATGLSMTFTSKPEYSWSTIASVMMTDCVVVVLSMLILNLSKKKQYPLYWLGLGWEGGGGSAGFMRSKMRRRASNVRSSASNLKGHIAVMGGGDQDKEEDV